MRVGHKYGNGKQICGKLGIGLSKEESKGDENHRHIENSGSYELTKYQREII